MLLCCRESHQGNLIRKGSVTVTRARSPPLSGLCTFPPSKMQLCGWIRQVVLCSVRRAWFTQSIHLTCWRSWAARWKEALSVIEYTRRMTSAHHTHISRCRSSAWLWKRSCHASTDAKDEEQGKGKSCSLLATLHRAVVRVLIFSWTNTCLIT